MAIKVGINGYGRIGRNVLRALYEANRTGEIQIVAINDLGDAQTNAHLTRYDTAHGKFPGEVSVDGDCMIVNGDKIRVLAERTGFEVVRIDTRGVRWFERGEVSAPLYRLSKGVTEALSPLAHLSGRGQDMLAWLRRPAD